METIIEIIKPAATVIAVIVPLFMKLISDNKKKKKRDEQVLNRVDEIDQNQNRRLDNFEGKITFLYDIHKYRPKMLSIITKLEEIIDFHTSNTNKEINRILHNSLDKITPIFMNYSDTGFTGIDKEKTVKLFERKASFVRESINKQILNVSNYEKFAGFLKAKIKPEILIFAQKLEELSKEMTNGERMTEFEKISIDLTNAIIKHTINTYDTFKNEKPD